MSSTNPNPRSLSLEKADRFERKKRALLKRNLLKGDDETFFPSCANSRNYDHLDSTYEQIFLATFVGLQLRSGDTSDGKKPSKVFYAF